MCITSICRFMCTGSIRILFVCLFRFMVFDSNLLLPNYLLCENSAEFLQKLAFWLNESYVVESAWNILEAFLCMSMTRSLPSMTDAEDEHQMEFISAIWTASIFQVFDQWLFSFIPGPSSPRRIKRTSSRFSESNTGL